ncbi:uncharacterized protein V1518DRAFT_419979 [Limtongia smithiae]|uniref:uncharacterized protein n=1 Tax=Limtongia smithiae TaxID=1125753 RepID=UPI0034CFADBC
MPDISQLFYYPPPPILALPQEILQRILELVHDDDVSCDGTHIHLSRRLQQYKRNVLPVCKKFYASGIHMLYAHVHIGHPRAFEEFRRELRGNPAYGPMVRCLDFSDFTSIGLGRTRKMNREIQMVTNYTIRDALSHTPNLREFLVSEALEDDIDSNVLDALFSLKSIEAVDFCGASSAAFTHAFAEAGDLSRGLSTLQRASFHECVSLPSTAFDALLPRLQCVQLLDLTHTQVSGRALSHISDRIHLQALSLSKCRRLSSTDIACFITSHPAVSDGSLQWLSLQWTNVSADDLYTILRHLRKTSPQLTHLNLYGLPVDESHLELIPQSVRELSLGYADLDTESLVSSLSHHDELRYVDLTGNPHMTPWTVQDKRLLRAMPFVRTWEFGVSDVLSKMIYSRLPGYMVVLGQGRRGWLCRAPPHTEALQVAHPSGHVGEKQCQYMLGMDMGGAEALVGASRKIDCSGLEYGGGHERGIYLYYAYRTR